MQSENYEIAEDSNLFFRLAEERLLKKVYSKYTAL